MMLVIIVSHYELNFFQVEVIHKVAIAMSHCITYNLQLFNAMLIQIEDRNMESK